MSQMNQTIDTIIFDVGNVLVDFQWRELLQKIGYSEEMITILGNAIFQNHRWVERDRGLLTDEEYLQLFIDNAPEYKEDIRKAIERSGETIVCFDYAIPFIKQLKEQGYKVYILSNFCDHLLHASAKDMQFRSLMDGEVFSCYVHHLKPEPEIYQILLERYGIEPQKAVFLDDRLENIEAAQDAGIHGIVFSTVEDAVEQLKDFDVHIKL